jgi:hypothetical protein
VCGEDGVEVADGLIRFESNSLRQIPLIAGQRLAPPRGTKRGVREEGTTYLALPSRLPEGGASYVVRQQPTYR